MASQQTWVEFNGAAGTPGTAGRSESDWKSVDDSTTPYLSAAINAGDNSYPKLQAIQFSGSWDSLTNLTFSIDTPSPGTGLSITGAVMSADPRPSSRSATGDTLFSALLPANFVDATSPWGSGSLTVSGGGTVYSQALRTQLTSTQFAASGDIGTRTITAAWTES